MFEVGKKYKHVSIHPGARAYTILYVGNKRVFARWDDGFNTGETTIQTDNFINYTEVKEPRSITPKWFNIFVNMSEQETIWLSGTPYNSKEAAQKYAREHLSGTTLIDTIEITYTEKV